MKYIKKYSYYISLTAALLFYVYITEPLYSFSEELISNYRLQSKRLTKTEDLLDKAGMVGEELSKAQNNKAAMEAFFFGAETEGQFKLQIQQQLDQLFKQSECRLDTLTWLEGDVLSENIRQWKVKIEFQGSPLCSIKLTRLIEESTPSLEIEHYAFGGQNWTGVISEVLNGEFTINVWRMRKDS
ncbi:hypothetical protein NI389_07460 [Pseudoalteromonas xiamenensis]|uniref:hypothetical protein n=1 Tax=Pseudoalteromonas xiamenensis TaxID=882626 RepID=UPI0027E5185B|nr:hypothetical protein [Pseudoalteromonas xiamenensis]WMN61210.1 hypothetical protein NI389_07460 [Pseudoalteromonas xiamenensis]